MKKGFMAISTVLIVTAVVLAISVTTSFLAIGEAQSSLASFKGEEVLGEVEGCVEDVLGRIRVDGNYNGGTISYPGGSCSVGVLSKTGNNWVLEVSSSRVDYNRKIRIEVVRNPGGLQLLAWNEI